MPMDTWRDYKLKNLGSTSCYIAGKIKDEPNHTELFAQGKREIQKLGLVPVCPIEVNQGSNDGNYVEYMKVDITILVRCSHIYMLNNYKTSKGALMELEIAKFFGMNIIYQPE